jgi:ferredoxin-nitrite reductase
MMFEAIAKAYMKYGLRGSRAKTRLFYLIKEIGMVSFVEKVSEFYPEDLEKKGVLQMHKASFSEFKTLKDKTFAYSYQSKFGKIDAAALSELVEHARKEHCEVRVGTDQNLYLLGLKETKISFVPVLGASHVTACAGSHYCALSLWDIKEETSYLPLEKIDAHNIEVGFSGCLKGCGKHYHSDIGLVGLRTNLYGKTQKAARVFLGGEYSKGEKVARLVFGVVPLVHLKSVFEVVIDEFEASGEKDFEDFSRKYLNPLSTSFLLLWFLSKLYLAQQITLELLSEEVLYQKLSTVKDFPKFNEDENYQNSIKIMLHALWDEKI